MSGEGNGIGAIPSSEGDKRLIELRIELRKELESSQTVPIPFRRCISTYP